jgi:hypothetical protein
METISVILEEMKIKISDDLENSINEIIEEPKYE